MNLVQVQLISFQAEYGEVALKAQDLANRMRPMHRHIPIRICTPKDPRLLTYLHCSLFF
jgi:hypothetical protein